MMPLPPGHPREVVDQTDKLTMKYRILPAAYALGAPGQSSVPEADADWLDNADKPNSTSRITFFTWAYGGQAVAVMRSVSYGDEDTRYMKRWRTTRGDSAVRGPWIKQSIGSRCRGDAILLRGGLWFPVWMGRSVSL